MFAQQARRAEAHEAERENMEPTPGETTLDHQREWLHQQVEQTIEPATTIGKVQLESTSPHVEEALMKKKPWKVWFLSVLAWLILGAFVSFHALDKPCLPDGTCREVTWVMALYFSIQSGLCVGFGLLTEKHRFWRFFTIFHSLVGLTFMASALGIFMAQTHDRVKAKIARAKSHRLAKCAPFFVNHEEEIWTCGLAVIWLVVGTAFEMWWNDWEIVSAFYFSFYALSTGGIVAPGTTDDGELLFVSAFMLTGIPIFGSAVSLGSDFFMTLWANSGEAGSKLSHKSSSGTQVL